MLKSFPFLKSLQSCFLDPVPDLRRTVLVAGIARSGTTWLSGLINTGREYRILFEPFHPKTFPRMADFGYEPYLRPDIDHGPFFDFTKRVLTGKVRGTRNDRYNRRLFYSRRLVKLIYANLALAWIHRRFGRVPIVYILRHPFAVACSKLNAPSGRWESQEDLLCQPALIEDHLSPYLDIFREKLSPFEEHVAVWCAIVRAVLRQASPGQMHVVFYENLCCRPQEVMNSVDRYLRRPFRNYPETLFRKPSPTSGARARTTVNGNEQIKKWTLALSSRDIDNGIRLIERFELNGLYNSGLLPQNGS